MYKSKRCTINNLRYADVEVNLLNRVEKITKQIENSGLHLYLRFKITKVMSMRTIEMVENATLFGQMIERKGDDTEEINQRLKEHQ